MPIPRATQDPAGTSPLGTGDNLPFVPPEGSRLSPAPSEQSGGGVLPPPPQVSTRSKLAVAPCDPPQVSTRSKLSAATRRRLHIVLVNPEIPHNTGAIGRTCVALGCDLALIRPIRFALDDAHIRRCGLDYWPYLDISVHENWEAYLEAAKPPRLFFLSTKGTKFLYETAFRPGDTLVFGCESKGLPPAFYERYADSLFRIPMPGEHARSLNLSNAVAIAAYEAYRQLTLA